MRRYEPFTVPSTVFKNFKDITLEGVDDFLTDYAKDTSSGRMSVEDSRPYTELKDRIAMATNFLEIMDILTETNFSDHEAMFRDLVDAIGG